MKSFLRMMKWNCFISFSVCMCGLSWWAGNVLCVFICCCVAVFVRELPLKSFRLNETNLKHSIVTQSVSSIFNRKQVAHPEIEISPQVHKWTVDTHTDSFHIEKWHAYTPTCMTFHPIIGIMIRKTQIMIKQNVMHWMCNALLQGRIAEKSN